MTLYLCHNVFSMKKYLSFIDDDKIASDPVVTYYSMHSTSLSDVGLQIVHDARNGVKVGYFLSLGDTMGLTLLEMSKILNVSLRTLQRYDPGMNLDTDASSKVLQLTILNTKGVDIFGDQASFNSWLRTSVPALEGSTPLGLLDTPFGYHLLFQILGRIEHGVFA
jgi:putative toxin-antitoxin system antitoxin component (TIGR02293 family)